MFGNKITQEKSMVTLPSIYKAGSEVSLVWDRKRFIQLTLTLFNAYVLACFLFPRSLQASSPVGHCRYRMYLEQSLLPNWQWNLGFLSWLKRHSEKGRKVTID